MRSIFFPILHFACLLVTSLAVVSLPGSILSTATTAVSPAPTLSLNNIGQLTTCQPSNITWQYSGSSNSLIIIVTNLDVPQFATRANQDLGRRQDFGYSTCILTANVDAFTQVFTWNAVTVPQGYYIAQASGSNISASSSQFYVANGTDTSCLLPSTSCLVSPTPSYSPLPPVLTSTSSAPMSTSGSPAFDATSSSHVNSGAVAGGVVGGLAVVVAVIAVFIFFRCRKSPRGVRARRSGGGWGGLSSSAPHGNFFRKGRRTASKASLVGFDTDPFRSNPVSRHQSQTSSIGRRDPSEFPPNGAGVLDEDMNSLAPSEEKIVTPTSDAEMFVGMPGSVGTLDSIAPLPYVHSRRSSASVKHTDYRSRRTSSYGNSTPDSWIPNEHGSTDDHDGTGEGEMIPMSGASGDRMRRTPRKPVPVYDPFDPPSAPAIHNGSAADDSSSDHHSHNLPSNISQHSLAMQMALNHKDSLGEMGLNKPVHYLIPDMPPPSQN